MAKSKSKKKKYLSLRRHLAPPLSPSPPPSAPKTETSPQCTNHHENKLDSFPLDPNVASLFFSSNNGEAPETLTDILGTASASGENPVIESSSIGSPESGLIGLSGGDGTDGLAKRALRGRQRVEYCCSSSSSEEEVASAINRVNGQVDLWSQGVSKKSPLLKLDYEEIITAWSDRGSLYIDEGIQIVPDVHQLAFPVLVDVGMTWIVPTVPKMEQEDDTKKKGEMETREMRVRRYKEKRRNRLFDKKIRYEVRKLNAEKRPRIKGRFVKATEDG